MTLRTLPATLLAALLLFGPPASATTMLRLDVPELSQNSDTVVHGTVRRVESRWSGDRRRILTDVEIEVTESLKGQPGSTVLVIQPGGKMGDIGQMVHGTASFVPGEEVVVFLERKGASAFQLSGMSQGKYQVRRAADNPTALAVPEDTQHVLLLDPDTRQASTTARKTLTLQELKAAVRTALGQPAQEKRQ